MNNSFILKRKIFNFILNYMNYEINGLESISLIDKNRKSISFNDFAHHLDKTIRKNFNIRNLKNIINENNNYKESLFYKDFLIFSHPPLLKRIYLEAFSHQKDLLLAESLSETVLYFIDNDSEYRNFINNIKRIILDIKFNYDEINNKFIYSEHIIHDLINNNILNLSNDDIIIYETPLYNFREAEKSLNIGAYSRVITESFKALESMIKIILEKYSFPINHNFSNNIETLKNNDFFRKFNNFDFIRSLKNLAYSRNGDDGHGDLYIHENNLNYATFYYYTIGNTLSYLIVLNKEFESYRTTI